MGARPLVRRKRALLLELFDIALDCRAVNVEPTGGLALGDALFIQTPLSFCAGLSNRLSSSHDACCRNIIARRCIVVGEGVEVEVFGEPVEAYGDAGRPLSRSVEGRSGWVR
jgi:hypothetical protein